MFRRKALLAGMFVIVLCTSLTLGQAQPNADRSSTVPTGSYTIVKMTLNGVPLKDVTLPGVPGQVPITIKPGGKISPPHLIGPSVPPSHDFWFQWWYGTYNASHSLMYEFSQYYDWTGNGNTVSYFQTDCWTGGGYWTFFNCSTKKSELGRSFVKANGNWTYGCCQNNYWTYNKYPHAEVTATADGTISGTVYSG